MIAMMVQWLEKYLNIAPDDLRCRLYIHSPYADEECEEYWARIVGKPDASSIRTTYKPTAHNFKRNKEYKGCLRITVPRGTTALKVVLEWQRLLILHYSNDIIINH